MYVRWVFTLSLVSLPQRLWGQHHRRRAPTREFFPISKGERQCPLEAPASTKEACFTRAKSQGAECFSWYDEKSLCSLCDEGCDVLVRSDFRFELYLNPLPCAAIKNQWPLLDSLECRFVSDSSTIDVTTYSWRARNDNCRAAWCAVSEIPFRTSKCSELNIPAKQVYESWSQFCNSEQESDSEPSAASATSYEDKSSELIQQPKPDKEIIEDDDQGTGDDTTMIIGVVIGAAVFLCVCCVCVLVLHTNHIEEDIEKKPSYVGVQRTLTRSLSGSIARSQDFVRGTARKVSATTQMKLAAAKASEQVAKSGEFVRSTVRKFSGSPAQRSSSPAVVVQAGTRSEPGGFVRSTVRKLSGAPGNFVRSTVRKISSNSPAQMKKVASTASAPGNFVRSTIRKITGGKQKVQTKTVSGKSPDQVLYHVSVVPGHAGTDRVFSKQSISSNHSIQSSSTASSLPGGVRVSSNFVANNNRVSSSTSMGDDVQQMAASKNFKSSTTR